MSQNNIKYTVNELLVLENDYHVDEYLSAYLNQNYPNQKFTVVDSLINNTPEKTNEVIAAVKEAKIVFISTRFGNHKQILNMLRLFNSDEIKRTYYIITPPDCAQKYINIVAANDLEIHDQLVKLFENNTIFEIGSMTTEHVKNESDFFRTINYYFDTVQMYYNKMYDYFVKERSFYFELHYKTLYKLKPEWVKSNSKTNFESPLETYVKSNKKEIKNLFDEIIATLDYRIETPNLDAETLEFNSKLKTTALELYNKLKK